MFAYISLDNSISVDSRTKDQRYADRVPAELSNASNLINLVSQPPLRTRQTYPLNPLPKRMVSRLSLRLSCQPRQFLRFLAPDIRRHQNSSLTGTQQHRRYTKRATHPAPSNRPYVSGTNAVLTGFQGCPTLTKSAIYCPITRRSRIRVPSAPPIQSIACGRLRAWRYPTVRRWLRAALAAVTGIGSGCSRAHVSSARALQGDDDQ